MMRADSFSTQATPPPRGRVRRGRGPDFRPFRGPRVHRAFTIIELLACLTVAMVLIGVILPAFDRPRGCCRPLKDSTQIRGIVQSMIVWSQNFKGQYPLPSLIDTDDTTLTGDPECKNTTGAILSILIFNGNISPEICISPAESNSGQVAQMQNYQFTNPKAAAVPANALWDPAFLGTPFDLPPPGPMGSVFPGGPANQSYAHLLPFNARRAQWADTFSTTEAVFGNRGPAYASRDRARSPLGATPSKKWSLVNGPTGTGSNTLLIHGGRTTWEGNIGFNDGHVEFITTPAPDSVTYSRLSKGKGRATPDNLFVDETDEEDHDVPGARATRASARNVHLRPIARDATGAIVPWID